MPSESELTAGDLHHEHPASVIFASALRIVETRYYRKLTDPPRLAYAGLRGMVRSVGDRYTRFLTPLEFRRLQAENSGQEGSIGADLSVDARGHVVVRSIDRHGPSAGILRLGDGLTAVGWRRIASGRAGLDQAERALTGEPGTAVRIRIRRPHVSHVIDVDVRRRLLVMPTVRYRMLPNSIGYVSISSFGEQSDTEVGVALRRLHVAGARGLILDLRGNPGGYLTAAVDIASRFIDHGPVGYTRDRLDHQAPLRTIATKRIAPPLPLAVLVDHWSASSAEIVAAGIQDSGSGILVGQRTYGKALVQTITPLPDGSALLVTTHHYYTPSGIDISRRGITPNVIVESARDGSDSMLNRAIAVLSLPVRVSRLR